MASPVQVVIIVFVLCCISFAFGWITCNMRYENKLKRAIKLALTYLEKIRDGILSINTGSGSNRSTWNDSLKAEALRSCSTLRRHLKRMVIQDDDEFLKEAQNIDIRA